MFLHCISSPAWPRFGQGFFAGMICLIEATGQDIPANDARLMDNFKTSMLTFKKERLSSEALDKIFTGSFYTVVPTYSHDD